MPRGKEGPPNPPVQHEINPAQHTATVSAETVITPADDSLLPFEQISQGDNSASIRQLRLDVYLALRHYFSYPPLARKRGWEGEVVVSIRINHDGYLQDIHLIRGSGYALLDRSALEALSRVDRIPNQLSQTIDMELPILYQLQEG